MILGTLLKITAQKKLMIKISPDTYHRINQRIKAMAKKNNFTEYSKPTWVSEQACSLREQTDTHFLMVKLDQYDVQNMQKFSRMIKSDVALDGFPKSYAFIPDNNEHARCQANDQRAGLLAQQKCGINFVLTTIRVVKKKQTDIFAQLEAAADEESAKAEARILDERKSRMTALELAIDGDVERQVAQQVGLLAQRFPLPTPPTMERLETGMTAMELSIDADVEKLMAKRMAKRFTK